jgi:hypothetical protein
MTDRKLVRCKVVGRMPVRDFVTKESVPEGGTVQLCPRLPSEDRPPQGSVIIEALVSGGNVVVLDEKPEPKAKS